MPAIARAAPTAVPRVSHRLAALALTLLLSLQPVTTGVDLPALPVLILAFAVAQVFCGPVADRVGRRGAAFTLAASVIMLVLTWLGVHHAGAVLRPQCLYAFGHGIHQPCGQARAVGPFPQAAGTASTLAGYALAGTAFLVGVWLGQVLDGSLAAWTLVQRIALAPSPA